MIRPASLLALFAALAGCAHPPPAVDSGRRRPPGGRLPAPARAEVEGRSLRMAFIPMARAADEEATVRLVVHHVAEAQGLTLVPVRTASYADAEAALTRGDADVAILAPLLYVRVLERFQHEADLAGFRLRLLLTAVSGGSPTGLGYVVAAADADLHDLSDLAGHPFGMVRGSTSGYLFPLDLLDARGLDPAATLAGVRFFDRHYQVLDELLAPAGSRRIDAGALYHHTVDVLPPEKRARLVILGKTARIPRDALVARVPLRNGHEDPEFLVAVAALQHAFLDLSRHPEVARSFGGTVGYDGWIPGDDRRYDAIRSVAERFGHYRLEEAARAAGQPGAAADAAEGDGTETTTR